MPSGGKRPGAGRPKGSHTKETLSKAAYREILRNIIAGKMEAMTEAQIHRALGLKFLVKRAKSGGKFEKVSAAELDAVLAGQDDGHIVLEVWDEFPSTQAYTDLMNRAFDKPAEQEQTINLTGSLDVIAILRKRHERHRSGK